MWKVLLLVILQSFYLIYGQSGGCSNLESDKCSSCLLLPGCAWCSDVNYTSPRCNTEDYHSEAKCNTTVTGMPDKNPTLSGESLSETNQIYPKNVQARVRVGEPLTFTLDIQPSKNYPVDFYILMDLSASMDDDLNNLKKLALNISAKLNSLTKKSRLGFGSFVDKVVPPYVKEELVGKPYINKEVQKDIPYDYKHALPFTEDAQEFKTQMENQISSGNFDSPEGTLDALMQVAACETELGWGARDKTRRMVLIATDSIFHMAGEGRFGGVVEPNDAKCHLGPWKDGVRLYTKSLQLDYPTLDQVKKRLLKSEIKPIFAISDGSSTEKFSFSRYKVVKENWESLLSATIGELSGDSDNIIDLIQESYDKITSSINLQAVNLPDNVKVEIKRLLCPLPEGTKQECRGVKPGTKVSFQVTITVTSCDSGNTTSFEISTGSFGRLNVDLDIVCSCDCEKYGVPASPRCNGTGSLVCGNCECNKGWSGEFCQCDEEKFLDIGQENCRSSNNTGALICSGNGECYCGECQCNAIPGETSKYYGQFCQCSDFNCDLYNGKPCGGNRGTCKCGKCSCKKEFIDSNCGRDNCEYHASKCVSGLENGVPVNCSGRGQCSCTGQCICDSFYQGKLCQDCPSCAGRCGDYKTCVLCKVFGVQPGNATLCENCPQIKTYNSLSQLQAVNLLAICKEADDEGCTYYYSYDNRKNATVLHVVKNKDCPEGPDVLLIVLAVIGGIVGIGIILLIIWKLLTAMVDRREYQKFEQDRAKSKWHREKNPLYQPATSTVQNPTFVGSKT